MSLWFDLRVNYDIVGRVGIKRLDPLVTAPGADAVCCYEVKLDDAVAGQVEHRYGDGALVLARKALELLTQGGIS